MSNYNDTSKLPICDKHRHEVINHALREEVIPLTVGMKLEQTVETLRELLKVSGETIAELRGGEDCDHSVGVCWCGVTKLQEEIEEALKETEASHD